jgi:large subunit ribosomal protein L29
VKAKAIRELSNEELMRRTADLKKGLVDFRMKMATGVKDNVREQRNNRRTIARINTILRERAILSESGLAGAAAATQQ